MNVNQDMAELAQDRKVVRARPAMPQSAPTVEIKTMAARKAEADAAAKLALASVTNVPSTVATATLPATALVQAPPPPPKVVRAPKAKPMTKREQEAQTIAFERERLRLWRAGVAPALTREGGIRDVRGNVVQSGRFMTDAPVYGPLRQSIGTADPTPYGRRMAAFFRENA